jgi:pilus assembly protein Flp/PilA
MFNRFARSSGGATAIEYGLIAALIAVAAIVSMQLLGINLAETFQTLANVIGGALGRD